MKKKIKKELEIIREFGQDQGKFWWGVGEILLGWFWTTKGGLTKLMYRQRGRFSQTFVNISVGGLVFLTIAFSGKLEELVLRNKGKEEGGSNYLIMAAEGESGAETQISNLPKGEITEHRVKEGETVSSISQLYGVSIDTIMWENSLKNVDAIKPGQILRILPMTGIRHRVKRGETVYSIAKYYGVDAQSMIDYPFNSFANDETFVLVAGQELMVPEGVKPKEVVIDVKRYAVKTVAPIPGVVGEGNFMWPTSGHISQRFYWYHQATDIANPANPPIVAAQSGTVVTAGWGGGYGNYVIIDHGNGYRTLYGHMLSNLSVAAGNKVTQGQKLGIMGSTGRSTGTHLHFEIIGPKGKVDPLSVLK